ncbi:hypothetical protein AGMMS50262_09680 [Bacteroidia bacterium]|nr:hypothetical protein AGMMS50262_09680 [Bacteroidia bacterium]
MNNKNELLVMAGNEWEQLHTSVKWNIHKFLTAKNQEDELQEDEEKYLVKIISGKLAEVALYFQRGIPVEMMYDKHGCFYEIFQDSFNKFYDVIENRLNDYIPTGSNESEYETIKITFSKPIHDVNKMFDDAEHWGVSNLKGWIENYESSRFTQIDERSAIITAEYNMQYIKGWLMQNLRTDSIEIII